MKMSGDCSTLVKRHERQDLTRKVASSCSNINKRDNQGRTALSYAIERMNDDEELESLARIIIDAGANINLADDKGQTPLFYASRPSAVRLLLEHGAYLTVRNNQQETALIHILAEKDLYFDYDKVSHLYEQCISVLLNYVDTTYVNARDMYGRTAMFYAVTQFDDSKMFEVIATMLVRKGAVVDDTDNNGMSVLSYFVERHCCNSFTDNADVSERLSFFIKNGIRNSAIFTSALSYFYAILPNYSDSSNIVHRREIFRNAIYVASTYASTTNDEQCIDTLNVLIDKAEIPEALDVLKRLGVNQNSADSYGNTALHYATLLPFHGVSRGSVMEILETLRNHGIRTNITNQEKETPLHFCLSEQAWKLASEKDTWNGITTVVEICEFLLQDGSLISETTRNGETVYHLIMNLFQRGLSMNDKEIRNVICDNAVRLLELFSKTSGEQLKVLQDHSLNSPLHLWASLSLPPNQNYAEPLTKGFTFQDLLDTIFKHLWKPGMSPNPRNDQDQTPLHLCKTWTAAKLLIEAGAKANDVDREGQPPLLIVAKYKQFKIKQGYFFPDVVEDPKQFFETCVSLGLDIWSSDNEGQSMLSTFLDSEAYALAKALIDVAVANCKSTTIVKQLLDAICKDQSTSTTWKSLLTLTLITSPQLASSINLDGSLRHICTNIEKQVLGQKQEQRVGIEEGNESEEPPNTRPRIDDTEILSTPKSNVFFDIGRQLLFYGADGNSLCNDFPKLHSFLTAVITPDQMKEIIPWTSHSTRHEEKLRAVSRKQNVAEIGTYCYHKEPIGQGGFGDVCAGICKNDGREVAIKKIKRNQVKGQDKREISNLVELADCPQVVKYISFDVSDKHFVFIVLELMEGHIDDYFLSPSFDTSQRRRLCSDVVEGLTYLHQHEPKPILHRDLKPENILYKFDKDGKVIVKIADFGLSSPLTTGRTTVLHSKVGTRCWIAPEVMRFQPYQHSSSSDVFSCGLVCHYILSKQKHPFSPVDCTNKSDEVITHTTEDNMLKYQMDGWDDALSPEATHLVKDMLQKDESKRPSAADSLHHPFFWSNKKKMDFLIAVSNQYEFECPSTSKRASHHITTAVKDHLENNFANIVRYAKWDDPNYKNVAKIVAEVKNPIVKINRKGKTYPQNPRTYDTSSVVELVRFIRNAINQVSERSRPPDIRKRVLEDFVFLDEFPHLLIEVYKAVTAHGWDNSEEIKYAITDREPYSSEEIKYSYKLPHELEYNLETIEGQPAVKKEQDEMIQGQSGLQKEQEEAIPSQSGLKQRQEEIINHKDLHQGHKWLIPQVKETIQGQSGLQQRQEEIDKIQSRLQKENESITQDRNEIQQERQEIIPRQSGIKNEQQEELKGNIKRKTTIEKKSDKEIKDEDACSGSESGQSTSEKQDLEHAQFQKMLKILSSKDDILGDNVSSKTHVEKSAQNGEEAKDENKLQEQSDEDAYVESERSEGQDLEPFQKILEILLCDDIITDNDADEYLRAVKDFSRGDVWKRAFEGCCSTTGADWKRTFVYTMRNIYQFLSPELAEYKSNNPRESITDLTFLAHGEVRAPHVPCTLHHYNSFVQSITTYVPWGCGLDASAAYGIATGTIRVDQVDFDGAVLPEIPNSWYTLPAGDNTCIPNVVFTQVAENEDPAYEELRAIHDRFQERARGCFVAFLPNDLHLPEIPLWYLCCMVGVIGRLQHVTYRIHIASCLHPRDDNILTHSIDPMGLWPTVNSNPYCSVYISRFHSTTMRIRADRIADIPDDIRSGFDEFNNYYSLVSGHPLPETEDVQMQDDQQ